MSKRTVTPPPAVTAPATSGGFVVAPRYVEHCYDDPEHPQYHGFCFTARDNITNGERRELRQRNRPVIAYSEWWTSKDVGIGDSHEEFGPYDPDDLPIEREWALFAPYVTAWNARGIDAKTGDEKELPPPSELGLAALDLLEYPVVRWLMDTIDAAYTGGKGLTSYAKAFAAMRERLSSGSTAAPSTEASPGQ